MSASEQVRFGRKRAVPSCPNPLFLQWLTELRDEARDRGLKTQFTYQKAISSLNKYPLPLQNAKEAKILQNFGDGICKILDQKLQRYYRENGPDAKIHSLPEGAPPAVQVDNHSLVPSKKKNGGLVGGESEEGMKKKRKKKDYIPQKRSGGYAVLLSLYKESQMTGGKGYMLKHELQTKAQHLCDKSLTVPEPGSKYTAWSSVSTLIQRNLLLKTHNPARYSLTEDGLALAERLDSAERWMDSRADGDGDDSPEVVDLTLSDGDEPGDDHRTHSAEQLKGNTQTRTEPDGRDVQNSAGRLLPGSYDILLCVDFIETTGGNHHRKQELVKELQRNGVNFDVRKLNVGDFLWVAREKVAPVPGQLRVPVGRELVLDYIIERKRMDDLCGSIIDGRFREQKFRMKRCGLRRPIYLVERGAAAAHLSIPEATLQQAIINTQVVDGFFVKRVQDVRESAAYLTVMTRHLTKLYQNCTLTCRSRELHGDAPRDEQQAGKPFCSLMSFTEFNQGAVKNKSQTVREVFARQLMQVSGLSGDKAAAILNHYSTPYSLITAYERCTREEEKEKLLSSIRYGKLKRNLGPALSRTIYQLYCSPGALT